MATKHGDAPGCRAPPPTGIAYPACGAGTLEPARGRFGPVYKCSNKGVCRFSLTARPTGTVCDILRDDGPPLRPAHG